MKFRENIDIIDPTLKSHLSMAQIQIDDLYKIEEAYLTLKAAKDTKFSLLFQTALSGTVEQKKAYVFASEDWSIFAKALAEAEAKFHRAKNKYEIALKYIDAAYLSLKIEKLAVERGIG